jgi:hypothetical protein
MLKANRRTRVEKKKVRARIWEAEIRRIVV